MTAATRIPFNYDHEADAADAVAEQLRLKGHDAHAEYIGSNTSVFVTLSPTRQALMCGWGNLEDWQVDFDFLTGNMWDRDEQAGDLIPGTTSAEITVLVDAIDAYLRGLDGYTPSTSEVRPLAERRAYNDILLHMRDTAGEISAALRCTSEDLTDNRRLLLADDPETKAALDAASDALDAAQRAVTEAVRHAYGLMGIEPPDGIA